MRTSHLLEELARRMEAIERDLAKVETAIIVREPTTPLAAEAFDGLRKQVLASSRSSNTHLAQLIEFDRSLRADAQIADLRMLVDGWLRQVGVRVLFEPVSQELFDLHGEGERVEVQTPAYVIDSGDGTQRVLQPGVALRYDNNASLAQEQPDSLPMASSDPEGEEVQP